MATFALIHGAWHGGWCWDNLIPLLQGEGHRTAAPDLPSDDSALGAADYARAVDRALGDADDLIVVAHSMGGLTAPLVAELRSVKHLVLLCALLPEPGIPFLAQLEHEAVLAPGADATVADAEGRTYWADAESAFEAMYQDCDRAEADQVFARLRPQARKVVHELSPLDEWPDVACTYVLCDEDRVVSPAWSRDAARERLGTEAIEIPGSHSPWLSRPRQVAEILLGVATTG